MSNSSNEIFNATGSLHTTIDVSEFSNISKPFEDMTTTLIGFNTTSTNLFGSLITSESRSLNGTNSSTETPPCVICTHDIPVWVPVIQAVFSIFVTVANTVTVTALFRSNGLKKIQKILLINQLISDMIVGLIYTYHSITVYIFYHSVTECIIRYAILCTASAVSMTTVALLSVERIFAIKFPYRYEDLNTTQNQVWTLFLCWCGPVLTIVLGFMYADWNIGECNFLLLTTPTTLVTFGAPSLVIIMVIIISNIILFLIARGHIKKIIPNFIGKDKYIQGIKMHLKATLTAASIVIPFLLTNIPQYIYFIFIAVYPRFRLELWALELMNFVSSLVLINSVINPIIYVWRIEDLRLQLLRVMCPSIARRRVKANM